MRSFEIRAVTEADAAIVARHRASMFWDMGELADESVMRQLCSASESAILEAMRDQSYVGWFALDERETVIGGVGAHLKPQMPRPTHHGAAVVSGAIPLVVNVYTEKGWRRRGVARALMDVLLAWARAQGFDRVVLHASHDGRRLYESLGFAATNEMRWRP